MQRLAGRRVLTWWEGEVANSCGQGEYVIADASYREIKRFSPANGYRGDLHEFTIRSRGTALVSIYHQVTADLSSHGGPTDDTVLEGVIQEIDLRTGVLLLEWHSLDHVASTSPAVRPRSDLVSIFDDGAFSDEIAAESVSRAIVLQLDTTAMSAELQRADASPHGLTVAMGSAQVLADGGCSSAGAHRRGTRSSRPPESCATTPC